VPADATAAGVGVMEDQKKLIAVTGGANSYRIGPVWLVRLSVYPVDGQ
jgi:hypothetical protein